MLNVPRKLHDAIELLDVRQSFVDIMATAKNLEQARANLEQFKRTANDAYKQKALEHHPDRGGNEETMKKLSAAIAEIKNMRILEPKPQPVIRVVFRQTGFGGYTSATGTTTATGWY
jgi:SPX domain protein involved in polyphosphate accumulation